MDKKMLFNVNDYISSVETLASTQTNYDFTTKTALNAAIVISKIIEHSVKEVKIYDHSITGDIAEQHEIFNLTLSRFLRDGKKLKIVLRYPNMVSGNFFDRLKEYSQEFPGQVFLRLANKNFRENLKSIVEKDVNFTVNDNNAYRIDSITSIENELKEAVCNFNNKEVADKLINLFDQFDSCSEILLPTPEFEFA